MTESDRNFFITLGVKDIDDNYTNFCVEQGILICEALRTKDNIMSFYDKPFDEQKVIVKGLDDGHSGNTFNQACRLAIFYIPRLKENVRETKINSVLGVDGNS